MAFRPLGQPRCLKQRHEPAHLSAGAMWDSRCDAPATSLLPCSIPSNGLVLSPWGWHGGSGRCVAAELFPLALGALHPWFHPSTVSEQNVPIIYFPTTPCYRRRLWLLVLCSCLTCFYSTLQHQQLVGFPCWYLSKVEVY